MRAVSWVVASPSELSRPKQHPCRHHLPTAKRAFLPKRPLLADAAAQRAWVQTRPDRPAKRAPLGSTSAAGWGWLGLAG